tara:strand:+ start:640 stop:1662 length:1023 start_codon:yes stop_codon:yes gene_type:complete
VSELKEVQIYGEFDAKIAEVKDACNFIPDVTSDDGYEKSKRVSLDVGKILTAVEKKRKEEKADSLAYGKKIDSEAKSIAATLEAFQLPHKDAYKELDNLKKEREVNRKAELEERVRVIRELPEAMADSDSDGVKMALESLATEECLDFYEYATPALLARNASKDALSKMFADKLKQEKEAAELIELRKKQAEQDQKDRDNRIAKDAASEAEEKAKASKEAEQRAIDQAAEAVKQREAAEVKAKQDAELAEERRLEAARQAKDDAATAAEDARQAEMARTVLIARQEQEAVEKRESNKRHVGVIRKAAKESLMAAGLDEATAKIVVMAINDGLIANISISY